MLRRVRFAAVATLLVVSTALVAGGGAAGAQSPAPAPAPPTSQPDWSVAAITDPRTGGPAWRVTWHPSEPLTARGHQAVITSDGRAVGFAVEAPDLRSISATTTDPRLVYGGPRFALTYGGHEVGAPPPPATFSPPNQDSAPPLAPRPPALAVDPARPGSYTVESAPYDLGDQALKLRSLGQSVEMAGQVYWSAQARGRRPVVVFLHGRHDTCFDGQWSSLVWPCLPGADPIPNHLGYAGPARVLASHGYVVISISANGVNAADGLLVDGGALARAQLVQAHLRQWRVWGANGGAPFGRRFVDRLSFRNVGLMGHSRGGEGVVRATQRNIVARSPFGIRAVLPLAPTSFERLTLPGVALSVVLPQCDGDVFELPGQRYVDDALYAVAQDPAPRSTVLVMGANHNFFNTEWTPGTSSAPAVDDWASNWGTSQPQCDPGRPARLTPQEQRAVGTAYIAGFFRLHLGREVALLGLFDGSGSAASAGRADVRVTAQSPDRADLHRFASLAGITARGTAPEVCAGGVFGFDRTGAPPCVADFDSPQVPHWGFTPMMPHTTTQRALSLRWNDAGDRIRVAVRRGATDFRRMRALTLRAVADPRVGSADLRIRLYDTSGAAASVLASEVSRALVAPAGTQAPLPRVVLQQIAVPMRRFAGIDLQHVAAVEIVGATQRGHVWLADLAVQRPALGDVTLHDLPALTIDDVDLAEGDSGTRTARFTITASRTSDRPITAYVQGNQTPEFGVDTTFVPYGFRGRVTIPAGRLRAVVEIPYTPNTVDNHDIGYIVSLSRVTQATTHRTFGWGTMRDDDPTPTLTITDTAAREGLHDALRFQASLSEASGIPVVIFGQLSAGTAQAGQDYADVFGIASEMGPGRTASRLVLPLVDDDLAEATETMTVDVFVGGATLQGPATLTGTIRDDDTAVP